MVGRGLKSDLVAILLQGQSECLQSEKKTTCHSLLRTRNVHILSLNCLPCFLAFLTCERKEHLGVTSNQIAERNHMDA